MRSNSSKNSVVSSSSVLEDCWGKGIVSSIGRTSFCARSALYALLPRNYCIFWGDRFFDGSDSAIIFPIPVRRCGPNQRMYEKRGQAALVRKASPTAREFKPQRIGFLPPSLVRKIQKDSLPR